MAMRGDGPDEQPWLLLIHQIPPKPDYFRVRVGRRLARVGAVAIKNSVYVLPATDQAMEDFQWILREIVEGGGSASICRAAFVDGLTDSEIRRLFHDARMADYTAIIADARSVLETLPPGRRLTTEQRAAAADAVAKLKKRVAAVARVDFFDTHRHAGAGIAVEQIELLLRSPGEASPFKALAGREAEVRGRTWVTRQGIFVDRIASAWLIRRFIDSDARFKFVRAQGYDPAPGELRFDMFDAEYTHEGDRCTFETLLRRFSVDDPVLADIAEVVHDIDLKDAKFERDDAPGIERVLAGIAAAYSDDADRLARGEQLFNELYALRSQELDHTARPRSSG